METHFFVGSLVQAFYHSLGNCQTPEAPQKSGFFVSVLSMRPGAGARVGEDDQMKVGCYTLDLYCDNYQAPPPRDGIHEWGEFPHQYSGPNKQRCERDARRDGWQLSKEDLCPKCSGKKGKS